ncbi:acetylornithine deacetylase [Salinarimonas ramus]|uniref:Acetylornithine deacetylase n=1 Tax=Salinarimonas ramus TaxID=690164 RepID=A0A917Q4D4_9HYPH|nr:acetylornithine deacetylase [Salinarimonas ramus]GGK20061.1 acetylornithine deacetylase [Salinarimonas ramus]
MPPARMTSLEMLERLVGFDTESHKSNLPLIDFAESWLAGHGVRTIRLPNAAGDKAALVAQIGPDVEGGVVLSGHTDVVPVAGQAWSSDPYRLRVENGRAYGRGATDMKGFDALVLALVPDFLAADLKRPITIVLSYDEETTCLGVVDAIAALGRDVPRPAAIIVGEPTGLEVADSHKGVAMCETRVTGTEAHSSRITDGASAVMGAGSFVDRLNRLGDRLIADGDATGRFDPPFSTVHVATIAGGSARNILARECLIGWEIRYIPGVDIGALQAQVEEIAREVTAERLTRYGPFGTIENVWSVDVPGLAPDEGSEAERLALRLAKRNRPMTVAYGSEAGRFQAVGLPTVLCGPGDIARAHKADEYITLDELAAGEAFLRRLADELSR